MDSYFLFYEENQGGSARVFEESFKENVNAVQFGEHADLTFGLDGLYRATPVLSITGSFTYHLQMTGYGLGTTEQKIGSNGPVEVYFEGGRKTFRTGLGLLADIIPKNADRNLSVGLKGYLSHINADYELTFDNRSEPSFATGTTTEEFRRSDWVFSLGYLLEWESFWNRHWGYKASVEFGQSTFAPNKMTRLQYNKNGTDLMPTLPENDKEYRFVDHPQITDDSQPRELNKETVKFNTFSFLIGVSYRF